MTSLKLQPKLFAFLVFSVTFLATNFVTAQIQIGSDIDGESLYDFSGRTSMPDAFTIAIGATGNGGNGSGSGHVRVFRLVSGVWIQKGVDIDGEAAGDNSGVSVSMPDSNTVAIGATLNNGNGQRSGHVRVFSWNGSTWVQKGLDIDGEVAFLESGNSVSMPDANTLAIGTMKGSAVASNAGQVRVFQFIGGAWVQKGGNIDGEAAQDGSGVSVSMPDANTVGIGALSNDGNGMNAGHVRVYVWNGTGWIQKGSDLDGEAAGDQSGRAICMPDMNTVAIGASSNITNGSHSGHVRIYNWNGTAWTQKGADIDGLPGDQFGTSVSMPNANTVAVGAPGNNNNNGNTSGAVRIFSWNGSAWLQRGNDIIGEASNDISGYSVSMPDVNTIGIGAIRNGGSAINAGHVRVFDVTPPPAPTVSINNGDSAVLCGIDSIYLTTTFTDATSFQWRNLDSADWLVEGNAGFSAGIASYLSLAVDNSGTPYVAYRDEGVGNKTTVQKFDGSNWVNVGSPSFSVGATFDHSIAIDSTGTPYVVYRDLGLAPGSQATVMRFDGNAWVSTGNGGFSTRSTNRTKIAFDDSGMLYLVYEDPFSGGKITVEKYDGTSWSTVGIRGFSAGQSAYPAIAFDGSTPYVAFQDATNSQRTTVMRFDGSAWVVVGTPGFSSGVSEFQNLVISNSGTPSVAYKDNGLRGAIVVKQYDGNTWNTLPNVGLAATDIFSNSLAVDNSGTLYLLFQDLSRGRKASVQKFNGNSWVFEGSRAFSSNSAGQINLAFDKSGIPYAGFIDGSNLNKATVMKLVSPIVSFGSGVSANTPGTYQVTAFNGNLSASDIIVIGSGVNTSASFSVSTCSPYSWQGSTFTSSGTYYAVIPNAAGCDSIMTLNLTFDATKPTVVTKNTSLYLDSIGVANLSVIDVNDGSSDNCGIPILSLSKSIFTCADLGSNTVWLIATDSSGNVDSSSAIVNVIDTVRPTVLTKNITVHLDSAGAVSIIPANVNDSSADACGIASISLSNNSFGCAEIGANTVWLIATDNNGNIDSANAIVTVIDTVKPTVSTSNVSVYLDHSGSASLVPGDVNNATADACGTPTLTLSKSSFSCAEVGANTIWLLATDNNGNIDSASAIVTVIDTVNPTVNTQNISLYLNNLGSASLVPADLNNNSTDACGIANLSLSQSSFNCAEIGANTVWLIATDNNGNVDSASAVVTVIDTVKPAVFTNSISVYLDNSGTVSISAADLNNSSTDACGIASLSLSNNSFGCAEIGANTVWLIATDNNGNIDSASAIVTVVDTVKPTVLTNNVTVYLDNSGTVSIVPADVNNASADACGISTLSLSNTTFSCSGIGANTVWLVATDNNGNIDSAISVITVLDTTKPVITSCPSNINQVSDQGSCSAIVSWAPPMATDNCVVDSLVASHNPGDTFSLGTTVVTYTAFDSEMNTSTCSFSITITDNEDPIILNMPSDITVSNDLDSCGTVVVWNTPTATDNCTLDSLRSDFQPGEIFPVGTTTVTYTAYDAGMNTSTLSFTITVTDTTLPVISCPTNIEQCDSIVNFSDATATDNCGIASIVRLDNTGLNSGDQFPVGITTISYLVTDVNNNQDSCSFQIKVFEPAKANAGPDLITRDIEPIQLQSTATNAVEISWTPFFSLNDAKAEKPLANPHVTTVYKMEVISADGCTDSDEVEVSVTVVEELDVTTLFSPNGDGRNDTWVVNKPDLVKGCQLVIFNRNGTEVYSTNDYHNEWDATVNGNILPEGTYYYVFDCSDGRTMNGPITVLRERR